MSEVLKTISDEVKPVLAEVLAKQAFLALTSIAGFGWFFGLPVISTVVQYIILSISSWMVKETAVGLSVLWIQLDLLYDVHTAEEAEKRLRDMLENPTKYSEREQKKIEEAFDDSTIDLIQLSLKRL
jgi:hypothetical protein